MYAFWLKRFGLLIILSHVVLLQLLRSIHSLWSPNVIQSLPGEVKAALIISDVERTSLLGEVNTKAPKGPLGFADGSLTDMSKEAYGEPNEKDIRNWLRGIRDSGYVCLPWYLIFPSILALCVFQELCFWPTTSTVNSVSSKYFLLFFIISCFWKSWSFFRIRGISQTFWNRLS